MSHDVPEKDREKDRYRDSKMKLLFSSIAGADSLLPGDLSTASDNWRLLLPSVVACLL